MAVTRVATGALASAATGNVTPGLPAGLTDSDATTGVADLMWCLISTHSNVQATMPAGWTLFQELNSSTTLRGTLFWKRYQAGDTDPLVTHAGGTNATTAARIIAYRGVKGTGNGMSGNTQGTHWNRANNTANSTARSVTGITTAFADCMIAYCGVDGEEGTHASYSSTNPTGATFLANEAMDDGITQGSDTGLWWTDAVRTGAAGATGAISCTASITAPFVGWILALEPAPPAVALSQAQYRFRNDDGTEATATWKAAVNTAAGTINADTPFRLRITVDETGNGSDPAAKTWKLQSRVGAGAWQDVNASATIARPAASPNVADNANTTQQLSSGLGTFVAGRFDEVDGAQSSIDLGIGGVTELEWSLTLYGAGEAITPGNTVEFRVIETGGALLDNYAQTPSLTVGNVARKARVTWVELEVPAAGGTPTDSNTTYSIRVTGTIGDVLVHDSFNRSENGTWGTADVGGAWGSYAEQASLSVDGSAGVMDVSGSTTARRAVIGSATADSDIRTRIWIDGTPGAGSLIYWIHGRRVDATNAYQLRITNASASFTAKISKFVASVESDVAASQSLGTAVSGWYDTRFQIQGTTLRAKVWQHGTAEPGTWLLSNTDTSHSSGEWSLRASRDASFSGTVKFEDFLVTSLAPPPSDSSTDFAIRVTGEAPVTTFPVVAGTATSVVSTDSTSHAVNLPSGINAGDLLVVLIATDGSANAAISTTSSPGSRSWNTGWADELESAGHNFGLRWRIADGSEGTTATFTTSTSEESAHQAYRITNHGGTLDATRVESAADGANPDPPAHTPSGGAADYLWLATFAADNIRTVSAYPTNFTDGLATQSAGAAPVSVGSARRELNASSLDPATFTISAADDWSAATIAIPPGVAGTDTSYPQDVRVTGRADSATDFGVRIVGVHTTSSYANVFPLTPVLDDFNRANGGIGSNWTADPGNVGYALPAIESNQMRANTGNAFSAASWNINTFQPDQEVYATTAVVGTTRMYLRASNVNTSSFTAYELAVSSGGVFLMRNDPGINRVLLRNAGITPAAGDKWGLRAIGNSLTIWRDNGGGWTQQGTAVIDGTYQTGGRLALWFQNDTVGRLDDFGGGNLPGYDIRVTGVSAGNIIDYEVRVTGQNTASTDFGIRTTGQLSSEAFPTTAVLDNFNRADGALGSNWTANPANIGGIVMPEIESNQAKKAASGSFAAASWNTSFDADQEVYATIAALPTTGAFRLYARLNNVGTSAMTGYELEVAGLNWFLMRYDSGNVRTLLEALGNHTFSQGVKVGLALKGDQIYVYQNDKNGGWVLRHIETDNTYATGGHVGIWFQNNSDGSIRIDDFGGGNTFKGWDARIIGAADASANFTVRTTGRADSNTTQEIRVTGRQDSADNREVRATGSATTSVDYGIRATGRLDSSDNRETRTIGRADSSITQEVRARGQSDSAAFYETKIVGQTDSNISSETRVTGSAVSSGDYSIRVTGTPDEASTAHEAEVRAIGRADISAGFDTRLTAQAQTADSRDARTQGQDSSTVGYDIYTRGRLDTTVGADVVVVGYEDVGRSADIHIVGEDTSQADVEIALVGETVSTSDFGIKTSGIAGTDLTTEIKANGQAEALTSVGIRVSGNIPTSDSYVVRMDVIPKSDATWGIAVSAGGAQYIRPSIDISTGGWTAVPSGSLYSAIDESPYNDVDYIQSSEGVSMDICEVKFNTAVQPGSLEGHIVRYRYYKPPSFAQINLTVELRNGTSVIASWTHVDITEIVVFEQHLLSEAVANEILDYHDLRLRFIAEAT